MPHSRHRPLWYDELVTYYLAAQPSLADFWSALAAGVDLNPPLHHLMVRAAVGLLGPGPVSVRLPSIIGFGIMAACLYQIASRRVGHWAAWVALCGRSRPGPTGMPSRPVPTVWFSGFSALAFWCWQAAAADSNRRFALLGLTLSLAAAISTHFYTALVFLRSAGRARTIARRTPLESGNLGGIRPAPPPSRCSGL